MYEVRVLQCLRYVVSHSGAESVHQGQMLYKAGLRYTDLPRNFYPQYSYHYNSIIYGI